MLYHRTVADVLEGTRRVVRELVDRVAGKRIRAVLAFECGARTAPFLGEEATLAENLELQHTLAPDAEYAGVVVWGELFPVGGRPAFHNYTYPLLVIAE
jgi:small ligand-binding sensory domain FIST